MHFSCCGVTCESSDVQLFLTEKLPDDPFCRPTSTGEIH